MKDLFEKCQEIVKNNINGEFDDTLIEMLGDAVLALLLIKPSLVLEKLPDKLHELKIIADKRSVIDMAHEDLGDYMEDEALSRSSAAVVKLLEVDDNDVLKESKYLLVSLDAANNSTDIICILIHELTHLLRTSWSTYSKEQELMQTKSGIEISTYSGKTNQLKRRNQFLEEGIVQFYTNMAIKELAEYLEDGEINEIETLIRFKEEIVGRELNEYLVPTKLIERLAYDLRFKELLDETFEEEDNHSKLQKYFNSVMSSNTAFSEFSKLIDNFYLEAVSDCNTMKMQYNIMKLNAILQEYFSNFRKIK